MKVQLTEEQCDNLTLWIEKLESGEDWQGTGKLRRGNALPEFCCLGVYADIKGVQWNGSVPRLRASMDEDSIEQYLREDWFEEQVGLSQRGQTFLAELNDGGLDFAKIARVLRHYMETGFIDGEAQ